MNHTTKENGIDSWRRSGAVVVPRSYHTVLPCGESICRTAQMREVSFILDEDYRVKVVCQKRCVSSPAAPKVHYDMGTVGFQQCDYLGKFGDWGWNAWRGFCRCPGVDISLVFNLKRTAHGRCLQRAWFAVQEKTADTDSRTGNSCTGGTEPVCRHRPEEWALAQHH